MPRIHICHVLYEHVKYSVNLEEVNILPYSFSLMKLNIKNSIIIFCILSFANFAEFSKYCNFVASWKI